MQDRPNPRKCLTEEARWDNRARVLEEISQGIADLMTKEGVSRSYLADRLGCHRSLISKVLGGSHNFTLQTLADISLAMGRGIHFTFGPDPQEMRWPVDEVSAARDRSVTHASLQFPTTFQARPWISTPSFGKAV